MSNPDTALSVSKYGLEQILESPKFKREIEKVLPKHLTLERMTRIALTAIRRIPALAECSPPSFLSALMWLSEVGLEPDGYHAHLLPFKNNKKQIVECQLIIDYKGLITVIRRNPAIAVVIGGVVYEHDKFIYREGSDRYFEHEPAFVEDDKIKGAYSFIKLAHINEWEMHFLPIWEIERTRRRSRAADTGPWVTDFPEMAKKTALRRHSKWLPLSPEEHAAVTADDDQFEFEQPKKLTMRPAEFRKSEVEDSYNVRTEHESESTPTEPSQNETQPQPTPVEDKNLTKLREAIVKEDVKESEVIQALHEKEQEIGDALESRRIADLPPETVKLTLKQWGTVRFTIDRIRAEFKGEV